MKNHVPRHLRRLFNAKWRVKEKLTDELRAQFPPWYAIQRADRTDIFSSFLLPCLEYAVAYLFSYSVLKNVEKAIVLSAVLRFVIAYAIERLIRKWYGEPWRQAHPNCRYLDKEDRHKALSELSDSVIGESLQPQAVQLLRNFLESKLLVSERANPSPELQKIYERLDLLQDEELLSTCHIGRKEDSPELEARKQRAVCSIEEYAAAVSEINAFLASRSA